MYSHRRKTKEGSRRVANRATIFSREPITVSSEFERRFDNEVLPLLRSQKGFIGELTLANPGSLERITTSLWESRGLPAECLSPRAEDPLADHRWRAEDPHLLR
jgi:hypothetical protein